MKKPDEEIVAKLSSPSKQHADRNLGAVKGWLSDDDPFLTEVKQIISARSRHRPRTLRKAGQKRRTTPG
jgi:hypothetical protein